MFTHFSLYHFIQIFKKRFSYLLEKQCYRERERESLRLLVYTPNIRHGWSLASTQPGARRPGISFWVSHVSVGAEALGLSSPVFQLHWRAAAWEVEQSGLALCPCGVLVSQGSASPAVPQCRAQIA